MNVKGTSPKFCPVCGQPDALIALGVRYDRPYHWRPWVTRSAHLFLCSGCDALVETAEGSTSPSAGTVPGRGHRLAYGPD